LSEEALERLGPYLKGTKAQEGWTGRAPLPGGDMKVQAVTGLIADLRKIYPFLSDAHAKRIAYAYGTRAATMLAGATSSADLGQDFGGTLTEREVRYLMTDEWALTAEDIVWRRSKLGLRMSATEIAALDAWIVANRERSAVQAREAGGRA
jgi:glycerol-3-phosphate dehydrogenase